MLLMFAGLYSGEVQAQDEAELMIDVRDAPVIDVLVRYSELLELNFVVSDEGVADKRITIYAPKPVGVEDARRMLFAALQVNGMNVELEGAYVKVSVKE
ncbi:MAG: hypothetical protein RBU37_27545 [Myxococcota bacterium]|jgi:type II secretory pathway component GspD/PulD (secretin)|nr:hypothetical protein [Myxococcota bacterium]